MNTIELTGAIAVQTAQLEKILLSGMERAQRQEEILAAVTKVNGYVRDHGETLAAHSQWMESHGKVHITQDKDFRALSGWVWKLGGGSGLLAIVATILQFLNL